MRHLILAVLLVLLAAPSAFAQRADSTYNPWTVHKRVAAIGYAGTAAATLVGSLAMNDEYFATTVLPVVGPFVTIARIESDPNAFYQPGGKGLLIASGVMQTAFVTYYVVSLIGESNHRDRYAVLPASQGTGLALTYRF